MSNNESTMNVQLTWSEKFNILKPYFSLYRAIEERMVNYYLPGIVPGYRSQFTHR